MGATAAAIRTIEVALSTNPYPVVIGEGALQELGEQIRDQGIKAGTVWVNCYGMLDPSIGFAGYKMSGYGVKGGPHQVESYLYPKVVYIKR